MHDELCAAVAGFLWYQARWFKNSWGTSTLQHSHFCAWSSDMPKESKLVTTLLILFQLCQLFVYVDSRTANTHRVVNSANLQ